MKLFQRRSNIAGCFAVFSSLWGLVQPASASPVTQTTAPAGSNSYWYGNGWAWQELGSVTLASGTDQVLALTSTTTLVDQGWGGSANTNGVRIDLFDNGVDVWGSYVAGASHCWTTVNYNAASSSDLTNLNAALAGVNWSTAPTVTLELNATPWAYQGWELHTQDSSFSVTSNVQPVPEPVSMAVLASGLLGLGMLRSRRSGLFG